MQLEETYPIKIKGSVGKRVYCFCWIRKFRFVLGLKEIYPIKKDGLIGKRISYFYLIRKMRILFMVEEVYPIDMDGLIGERTDCFYSIKGFLIPSGITIELYVDYPLQYDRKIKKNKKFFSTKGANQFVLLTLNERKEFLSKFFLNGKVKKFIPRLSLAVSGHVDDIEEKYRKLLDKLYPKDQWMLVLKKIHDKKK